MEQCYPFEQVPLKGKYDDFLPYLSMDTVYVHYNHIYKDAVLMLNHLIAAYPQLQSWTLTELITENIRQIPATAIRKIKFYAGNVYYHGFYFGSMSPPPNQKPSGKLEKVINNRYGNLENFKNVFQDAARSILGVGWVWLNAGRDGSIHIALTSDSNSPALRFVTPILALDLWEHAYFCDYTTESDQYAQNWLEVVDWKNVSERYERLCFREKSTDDSQCTNGANADTFSPDVCTIW